MACPVHAPALRAGAIRPQAPQSVRRVQARSPLRSARQVAFRRGPCAPRAAQDVRVPTDPTVRLERVEVQGGEFNVRGILEVDGPKDLVYAVLCDYDAAADIFHNVLESSAEDLGAGRLKLMQTCRWSFLLFGGSFESEIDVVKDEAAGLITFELVQSGFMNSFSGKWKVVEGTDGRCVVEHDMATTPKLAPPGPMAGYTRKIFGSQVTRLLEDLAAEVARRQMAQKAEQN
ncbi:unnamed protein product [Pedinophyceae sp. YPF-701]|nr:unnamed protein product [Pedinophyceae sp. YPF-701]